MKEIPCTGCGTPAERNPGQLVPACPACWSAFVAIFNRPADASGLVLDEGPVQRIADAILVALGREPAQPAVRCRKCGKFLTGIRAEMRIDRCAKCDPPRGRAA